MGFGEIWLRVSQGSMSPSYAEIVNTSSPVYSNDAKQPCKNQQCTAHRLEGRKRPDLAVACIPPAMAVEAGLRCSLQQAKSEECATRNQ
jgi:hypothetical protein